MSASHDITLRKLEIFLVFMRERNLARAAEAMSLSSVSVHKAIHSLEDAIGAPLFSHRGRSLDPLPAAETLERHAADIIDRIQRSVDATRQAAGISPRTLRVGALYSLTIALMPRVIGALKKAMPGCDIELVLGSNTTLIDALAAGDVDAAFVCIHNLAPTGARTVMPLFDDEMYLAMPAAERASGEVDLRNYADRPFVVLSQQFASGRDSQRMFQQAGITPRVALRANDIFSLSNLVCGGLGLALLPHRMAQMYPETLAFAPVIAAQRITQTLGLCHLSARTAEPSIDALRHAANLALGAAH